ncbi:MAG: L,D-transpeptidase family protein [Candidatus Omnitrophica bacterium]|nr:L,D-transpeptidase family protein [Candidatus Omnitrophota bacterium]MCM8799696.1 L,D-transpeptidase family protein [Candidatus Omnitrophota bacterium]
MKNFYLIIIGILIFLAITMMVLLVGSKKPIPKKEIISIENLLNQAKEFEEKLDLISAKAIYQRLITEFSNSKQVLQWQKKIEEINIKLLFSPIITKGSFLYEIKTNDTLTKIAKEFNTTVELIMKANDLKSDRIYPGRKIKVYNQPFTILIDKSQNLLFLKSNEEIIKTYVVSTGKNNLTPSGTFKIINKLKNPTWYKVGAVVPPSSPENILGSRWLGFDLKGYGIHGTNEPESLGKSITQGCIRMSNEDVEELYTIVPLGTEVIIVD